MKLNKDKLNNSDVKGAALAAMTFVDTAQNLPPEDQVLGITATFKLLMEHYQINPQDAFSVANNVMNHADGRRTEFEAVRLYMENEL